MPIDLMIGFFRFDGPSQDTRRQLHAPHTSKQVTDMQKTGKPSQQATPVQPNVQPKAREQKVNYAPPSGESSSGSESDNGDDSGDSSDTSDDEEMTERVNSVVAMVQGVKHNLQASQGVTSKVTTPSGSQPNKSQSQGISSKVTTPSGSQPNNSQNPSKLNSNTVQNKGNQNLVQKGAIKRKASDSSSSESSSDSGSDSDSSDDSGDESNNKNSVKSVLGTKSEEISAKSVPKPVLKSDGSRNISSVECAKVLTPLRNQPVDNLNNIHSPLTTLNRKPVDTPGPTPKSSTPAITNKQTPGGSETKPKRKRKRTRKRNRNKGTPGRLHSKTTIEQT